MKKLYLLYVFVLCSLISYCQITEYTPIETFKYNNTQIDLISTTDNVQAANNGWYQTECPRCHATVWTHSNKSGYYDQANSARLHNCNVPVGGIPIGYIILLFLIIWIIKSCKSQSKH